MDGHNDEDNPFYVEYDYLLELAHEYDFVISLGDGMRSGCLHDASDRPKFMNIYSSESSHSGRAKRVRPWSKDLVTSHLTKSRPTSKR